MDGFEARTYMQRHTAEKEVVLLPLAALFTQSLKVEYFSDRATPAS